MIKLAAARGGPLPVAALVAAVLAALLVAVGAQARGSRISGGFCRS